MIRTFRAELVKFTRPRTVAVTLLLALVVGVSGAALVMGNASPVAEAGDADYATTVEGLAEAGGGTELFRRTASFAGSLVFVLFVGVFAVEYSRGTYRTMLLRQPHRLRLLAGKLLAPLAFAAGVLAFTAIVFWTSGLVIAPGYDISTDAWVSADGLLAGLGDYGMILIWMTGYAVFGMTVAMLLKSVPLALAVGVAWAMPFEHILYGPWPTAQQVFPGLLLEAVAEGGRPEVTAGVAAISSIGYMVLFMTVAGLVFQRRDVTA
ncbi:ABC transporter permease [Phytoactinopolyspora endophytica]|uniref:ABC transporter permease n=1 Tax=Phytoactinopolyspora endophytica TaxID=1642495 RepID=UPI00101DD254|nr:ABC transporter permease [Phytoactinopolyspora endophytica]